jgi:hypothetical protein
MLDLVQCDHDENEDDYEKVLEKKQDESMDMDEPLSKSTKRKFDSKVIHCFKFILFL